MQVPQEINKHEGEHTAVFKAEREGLKGATKLVGGRYVARVQYFLVGRRRSRCFPWRCPHGRSAGPSAGRSVEEKR